MHMNVLLFLGIGVVLLLVGGIFDSIATLIVAWASTFIALVNLAAIVIAER